jgi:hypothetical protein
MNASEMTQALLQLSAVVIGGLLTIASGFFSTLLLERRRQKAESLNLALAFKGEITALLALIKDRRYQERLLEVIAQIEKTREPFLMPFRIRFEYDRVYESNVDKIGMLKGPLPELIPHFYTRLVSLMEDMVSLGDGTYSQVELTLLLRIYRDTHRILGTTIELGEQIVREVDHQYP